MTPYEFIKYFIKQEETHYYAKYRSEQEWIKLFKVNNFNLSNKPHGSYYFDQKLKRYIEFEDKMNGVYLLFQK